MGKAGSRLKVPSTAFIDAIRTRKRPVADVGSGLAVVRALEVALRTL